MNAASPKSQDFGYTVGWRPAPSARGYKQDEILQFLERRGEIIAASSYRAGAAQRDEEIIGSETPDSTPVQALPLYTLQTAKTDSFTALQEWEGVVTAREGGAFFATLIDVTAGERSPNEVAELLVEDVQEEDLPRLKPGAIFRWVIGYATSASGTKTRGSRFYFRRLLRRHDASHEDLEFET